MKIGFAALAVTLLVLVGLASEETPTAFLSPAQVIAGDKDDGQQGDKDDGQQGDKDDGQGQGNKDDGQQGDKDDGQQGDKDDG